MASKLGRFVYRPAVSHVCGCLKNILVFQKNNWVNIPKSSLSVSLVQS